MVPNDPELVPFAQQIAAYAESELEREGYDLSSPARERLRTFVYDGLLQRGASEPDLPQKGDRVQACVTRLVNEIADQSSSRYGIATNADDSVVSAAIAKLCPGFWPFC